MIIFLGDNVQQLLKLCYIRGTNFHFLHAPIPSIHYSFSFESRWNGVPPSCVRANIFSLFFSNTSSTAGALRRLVANVFDATGPAPCRRLPSAVQDISSLRSSPGNFSTSLILFPPPLSFRLPLLNTGIWLDRMKQNKTDIFFQI